MLRYKVFNWGSFVIYYRNITGESIWTEDHILTMAFKFGPENLAKITCTEYCHDSVGIRPKALLIDIAYQCRLHTSDHVFGHVRWYNSLSFKSILSKDIQATETTWWTIFRVWSKLIELCFISVGDTHLLSWIWSSYLVKRHFVCWYSGNWDNRMNDMWSFVKTDGASFHPSPHHHLLPDNHQKSIQIKYPPWQSSKIKNLFPDKSNQASSLTQII